MSNNFDVSLIVDGLGGQGQVDVFLAKKNSSGNGYDILDPTEVFTSPTYPDSSTLTVLTTPTRSTALVYSFKLLGDHVPTLDDKGVPSMTLDNYDASQQLNDRMIPFSIPSASNAGRTKPEYILETGVKRGGNVSSDKFLLFIAYGHVDSAQGSVETVVFAGNSQVKSLGSHKDGSMVQPEFVCNGQVLEADFSVNKDLFDSTLVTVAANQTIHKVNNFLRKFYPKGANAS